MYPQIHWDATHLAAAGWFTAGLFIESLSVTYVSDWLKARDVNLGLFRRVPLLMDWKYLRYCKAHGQSYFKLFALRIFSMLNALLSIIFAWRILFVPVLFAPHIH